MLTRERFLALLGPLPDPAEPDPVGTTMREEMECVVEAFHYTVEPGERIRSWLVRPLDARGPLPLAVAIHTTGGDWRLGKAKVMGDGGQPPIAFELARQGFIVLVPDTLGYEERQLLGFDRWGADQEGWRGIFFALSSRLLRGETLLAKNLSDLSRGIDAMATRPDVDSGRIAALGHSFGAGQAAMLAAVDDRVSAAVFNCGTTDNRTKIANSLDIGFSYCVPGLLEYGDVGDILGLIAPRALLVLSGSEDPSCLGHDAMVARARDSFLAAESSGRLEHHWFHSGHEFSPDARAYAYDWLASQLIR